MLAIGVVSPIGSKGDLAQYRASVDQLKNVGSVRLCYPGASYNFDSRFFADINLLPHPSELALSRNLLKMLKGRPLHQDVSVLKSADRPTRRTRLATKISSFYDRSFTLREVVFPLLTKRLVSQLHSDFDDIDFAIILGHTLEKSLMSRYLTSYFYPKFVLKKPTIIFPFSVSQLGLEESAKRNVTLIKMILRRIDMLFLREERSYKYLIRMIGARKNLFQAADPAFLLSETSRSNVTSKIRKSGIDIKKPSIAVALRSDYFLTYAQRYGSAKFTLFLKKIAKLLDRLVLNFDAFIYFVPMTINPNGRAGARDDLYCSKECFRYMKNRKKAYIINTLRLNAYEIKTLLGLMDFLITTRLHAGILATSKYVPTLMILPANDNKAIGVAERLGIKENFIDLDYAIRAELEQLCLKVSEAIGNRDEIRERLKMTIPREQELAAIPMTVLKRIMVWQNVPTTS